MQEGPSSPEILNAVIELLKNRIAPKIEGHESYALRVAINSLQTVQRELELRPDAEAAELARLRGILGQDGSVSELNTKLCEKIRDGTFTLRNKSVVEHLKQTAMDQVKIDQPRYSGLTYALEHNSECPNSPPAP